MIGLTKLQTIRISVKGLHNNRFETLTCSPSPASGKRRSRQYINNNQMYFRVPRNLADKPVGSIQDYTHLIIYSTIKKETKLSFG